MQSRWNVFLIMTIVANHIQTSVEVLWSLLNGETRKSSKLWSTFCASCMSRKIDQWWDGLCACDHLLSIWNMWHEIGSSFMQMGNHCHPFPFWVCNGLNSSQRMRIMLCDFCCVWFWLIWMHVNFTCLPTQNHIRTSNIKYLYLYIYLQDVPIILWMLSPCLIYMAHAKIFSLFFHFTNKLTSWFISTLSNSQGFPSCPCRSLPYHPARENRGGATSSSARQTPWPRDFAAEISQPPRGAGTFAGAQDKPSQMQEFSQGNFEKKQHGNW